MAYADKIKVPFTAIIGDEEAEKGMVSLKDMASGQQEMLSYDQAVERLLEAKRHESGRKIIEVGGE